MNHPGIVHNSNILFTKKRRQLITIFRASIQNPLFKMMPSTINQPVRLQINNSISNKKLEDFRDRRRSFNQQYSQHDPKKIKHDNAKLIFCGNGASASISAHGAVDFSKQAKIRSVTFNEANLITCLANDYGYENWVKKTLEFHADAGDLIILISSKGESKNMINACKYLRKKRFFPVITLTGFKKK